MPCETYQTVITYLDQPSQRSQSTMRIIAILSLLLLASPVFGELTKEDLRTIIKEEVRPIIKEEITASEKRTKEYIDLKIETVNTKIDALDKRIGDMRILVIALIALITAAIAIPQIIIAYKERGQKEMQTQIEQLRQKSKHWKTLHNTPFPAPSLPPSLPYPANPSIPGEASGFRQPPHCTPLECYSWTNRPSIDITLRWSEKQSRFPVFWFSRLESC